MPETAALFFDVGGVLLTNGWDRHSRQAAVERFGLDADEYADRHEAVVNDLETGRLGLDEYLDRTVFCSPRTFTREEFVAFMHSRSRPHEEALELARELAASGRYLLATLNNESRELNRYRLDTFGLRSIFRLFFSSCYLGAAKPSACLFRTVVGITQLRPEECVFIDDREQNVEVAREVGLRAVRYRGAEELRRQLAAEEVRFDPR